MPAPVGGPPYMASTSGPNILCIAERLTFWVAVSSPSSWSSSLGSIRKFLTRSTRANFSLVSSMMSWTSLRTSGFSVRSRYVVYGRRWRCAQSPTVSSSMPISAAR